MACVSVELGDWQGLGDVAVYGETPVGPARGPFCLHLSPGLWPSKSARTPPRRSGVGSTGHGTERVLQAPGAGYFCPGLTAAAMDLGCSQHPVVLLESQEWALEQGW